MVVSLKSTVKIHDKVSLVAIDLSKNSPTCRIRVPAGGPESKLIRFRHTRSDYERLYRQIESFGQTNSCDEAVVAFESTGVYGTVLSNFFASKPVKLVQVNPFHTKRVKEIADNSPNKTDAKDPRVILDLVEMRRFLTVVIPTETAAELRVLVQNRERAIEDANRVYNRLHDLVFQIFPELLQIFKSLRKKTVQILVQNAPRPIDAVMLGQGGLTQLLRKGSRGQWGAPKAAEILDAAKRSLGVIDGQESLVFTIRQQLLQIQALEQTIKQYEHRLKQKLKEVPYAPSLLSIRGVGIVIASGVIGEMANFRDFRTVGEVLKFAGLNLFEISSGTFRGRRRISKRGRPLLRKLLYFGVVNMVRGGGIFHSHYQRLTERGMERIQALTALMRKLLSIMFALARDNSTFSLKLMVSHLSA